LKKASKELHRLLVSFKHMRLSPIDKSLKSSQCSR